MRFLKIWSINLRRQRRAADSAVPVPYEASVQDGTPRGKVREHALHLALSGFLGDRRKQRLLVHFLKRVAILMLG